MISDFISSAKEWYTIYNDLSDVMQTKPFDKIKFLHYLHLLNLKVNNAHKQLLKSENLNKDLDCSSFIFSSIMEYGLKHGITLEEMQKVLDVNYNETETKTETKHEMNEQHEQTEPILIPSEVKNEVINEEHNEVKSEGQNNDLDEDNEFLKKALNEMIETNDENTIEKTISVTMNKNKNSKETVWYLKNYVVSEKNIYSGYSTFETIWLVISFIISFMFGMRYLFKKK